GTLCYEPFFLWPFAIVILSCIKHLRARGPNRGNVVRVNCLVLSIVYAFYFLFYLFTRSLKTYERPVYEISQFLKLSNFTAAGFLVLFNTLYNNIAVNFLPFLTFPLKVTENIYMAGPLVNYIARGHKEVVFIGGAFVGILLVILLVYLHRKRLSEEFKIIALFLFLMLSETYILFFCRLVTDELVYSLTEFRYQYIPNAFIILSALFIANRFFNFSRYKKIIYPLLALILVFNIYCIRKVVNIYNYHFAPLETMLSNIKRGIRNGSINQYHKLYIDKDMPDYLPHLCWNIELGERFMPKGNYQWMFSRGEIGYFADNLEDASWIIDKDNFSVAQKNQAGVSENAKKINAITDKWYIALGKDQKYSELGSRFRSQGRYEQAEA
ncbi:MAG: hypothetical protein Q7U96_04570, partial [Chloroflexota bacterium]|nr:hypothetical protein [Chloroflexota bacterium]